MPSRSTTTVRRRTALTTVCRPTGPTPTEIPLPHPITGPATAGQLNTPAGK